MVLTNDANQYTTEAVYLHRYTEQNDDGPRGRLYTRNMKAYSCKKKIKHKTNKTDINKKVKDLSLFGGVVER